VATAIVTATLFFLALPVSGAQSELLARTQPTIFDVLIAFFGGAAGVVAYTRKDRTVTVISGVAIATALMPPLCTAGYGIATGQWRFFGGALYLFLINAIFIALSTYAIVRVLKYHPKVEVDRRTARRVKRIMWAIIVVTILPSVFIAFRLIDKSVFERNVARMVDTEFRFEQTAVLETESTYALSRRDSARTVTLKLWGETLPDGTIEGIRSRLSSYDLAGVMFTVNQASGGAFSSSARADAAAMGRTVAELRAIVPSVERVSIARHPVWRTAGDGANPDPPADTMVVCIIGHNTGAIPQDDLARVKRWLEAKHKTRNVKLYVEKQY
jgi:hypothetical protein